MSHAIPTELSSTAILKLESMVTDLSHDYYFNSPEEIGCLIHWVGKFPNGYGFSLVKGDRIHFPQPLHDSWEIAVMKNGMLVYDTPVTNDVISYLSEDEAMSVINEIAQLPPA